MTRDRLADLKRLSMQNGTANGDASKDEQVIELETVGNEKSKLLDPFFQQIETIQSQIDGLKQDIEKIQKLHSFLLRATGDVDSKKETSREIEMLDIRVKKAAVSIKARLQEVN